MHSFNQWASNPQATIILFKNNSYNLNPLKMAVMYLNHYVPVVLILLIPKCFGIMVIANIKHNMPNTLDPQEFA